MSTTRERGRAADAGILLDEQILPRARCFSSDSWTAFSRFHHLVLTLSLAHLPLIVYIWVYIDAIELITPFMPDTFSPRPDSPTAGNTKSKLSNLDSISTSRKGARITKGAKSPSQTPRSRPKATTRAPRLRLVANLEVRGSGLAPISNSSSASASIARMGEFQRRRIPTC